MEKNAKKIAYWPHAPSGCMWYRIETPMNALKRAGFNVDTVEIDKDFIASEYQSVQFYGAVPFSMEKVLKYMKEQGIKIVYDSDDALELIDETNPFYHAVKKDAPSTRAMLEYADEVTVANAQLAEYYKDKTKAKITIVPNCYNPAEWNHTRTPHEEIRIGFAGSATHVPDLIEIIPAIRNLQAKYNIKFYIMGFGQTTYEEWFKNYRYIAQPVATKALRELDALLKTISFEWVPFVDYRIYPKVLTEMSLDIGLCPLKETPFNNCRTASKAMEYNLSGAIVLASDSPTYNAEPTSVKVPNNNWEYALEAFIGSISNSNMIKDCNEKCTEWIKENRAIDNQLDLLKSVYVVK